MKLQSEVVHTEERKNRKIVITRNSAPTSTMDDWVCAYVCLKNDEIARKLSKSDLPIEVNGGITYRENHLPKKFDETCYSSRVIGWDYNHSWNKGETDLEEVKEEARDAVDQLEDLTLEKAVRHKLEYMPDWFVKGLDVVYK